MSASNSDHLHRSTLNVYSNLTDHFNPGLQKLVTLGNSYVKAFQSLALTSEAYFSAIAKMGEQAIHTASSRSLGDVLIQISETLRRLTAEIEGVFQWFHIEVLQAMDKNVKLDEEYINGSKRVYELEVRNQAAALERQLRRGAFRDSLEGSDYMQYLRQSHHDILKEEERRYRFLAEKHCGLTQSLLFLINKTGTALHQNAEGWKEKVQESHSARPRTPIAPEQEAQLRGSLTMMLQPVENLGDTVLIDQQSLGRVPSRAPSPLVGRSRSNSVGESLGLAGGRPMRALASHPASSNPVLLPFSRGDAVTVLLLEPRNGWLYGRIDSTMRQGWFPAGYVTAVEDYLQPQAPSGASGRRHSVSNVLDVADQPEQLIPKEEMVRRSSVDVRPVSPLPEKKPDPPKTNQKTMTTSYNEIPTPVTSSSSTPLRRASVADVRAVSPLPDRRAVSHFDSKPELLLMTPTPAPPPPPPPPPLPQKSSNELRPISPLPDRNTDRGGASSPGPNIPENPLFPRGTNPFATVKLKPTTTNDRSAPRIH
ncbi:brain-specific angiogenesis inhibitor 1-associated protein 2-like protein 2 [Engraulis encrasicolus]|uniref:brain-specific angiogenesis inhibitor 1-associated protein 2-like protein 2 n=1 Tax=Engraulis encrasicolus TaxID=184585 RepID=UPI002FD61AAE